MQEITVLSAGTTLGKTDEVAWEEKRSLERG